MTPPEPTVEVRRCGDHRPGIGRAWCHLDGEWCYQNDPCRGCTIVVLQASVVRLEAALLSEMGRVVALEAELERERMLSRRAQVHRGEA